MKITCFYEPCGPRQDRDWELISLWRETWTAIGWEPVVLNEEIAKQHPLYQEFNAKVSRFPTVNDRHFERFCFMRWLAFLSVGGGIVSDYDVLPIRRLDIEPTEPFCGDIRYRPGFLFTTPEWCRDFVQFLLGYELTIEDTASGQPHVSDMSLFQRTKCLGIGCQSLVHLYGSEGWERGPLVHFNNASLDRFKARVVKTLLCTPQ